MSLTCSNVTLAYPGSDPIITGLTLSIDAGELVFITGPSGTGKTTLLRALAGRIAPAAGSVSADGFPSDGDPACRRSFAERVALTEQLPERQLFATTVYDEVAFGPRNLGLDDAAVDRRVRSALACVGLDADAVGDTSPFAHSGGEKRRIAIADMLALETPYLLLDEPTAGLDPRERQRLLAALRALAHEGRGIAIVTHDAELLARKDDRVVELSTLESKNPEPAAPNDSAAAIPPEPEPSTAGSAGMAASAPRIGIYRPGFTLAHWLDPLAKLIFCALYLVSAFVARNAAGLCVVAAACILALGSCGFSPARALRTLRPFIALMTFVLVFNALFTASGPVMLAAGPLSITTGGIAFGIDSVARFALVLLGTAGLMATTSPTELSDAAARAMAPLRRLGLKTDSACLAVQMTLRFVPTLAEELDRIRTAQEARLADFSQPSALARVRAHIPVIVPLLSSAFRRADTLALAIQNREWGAHPNVRRTCLRAYRLQTRDGAAIAVAVAVLLAAALL